MTVSITTSTATIQLNTSGIRGPAGPAYVPVGVLVYSQADLPAPAADVITLDAQTYEIMGVITLDPVVRIVMDPASTIFGLVPNQCQIIGSYDGPLITKSGSGGIARITGVRVENTSLGESAQAIALATTGGVVTIERCNLQAFGKVITIAGEAGVRASAVSMTTTKNNTPIVEVGSCGSVSFDFCQSFAPNGTGRHFRILGGATLDNLAITQHGFIAGGVDNRVLQDSGATIAGRVTLERVVRYGAAAAPNDGWSQATSRYHVTSVDGLPDSSAIGDISTTVGFTQVINTQNVYEVVAPVVGSPWALNAESERFSLESTSTGGLRYTGTVRRKFIILGGVTLSKGGTVQRFACAVTKNGALIPSSVAVVDVTNRAVTLPFAPALVALENGDILRLVLANQDGTDDPVIAGASLEAMGGNIN